MSGKAIRLVWSGLLLLTFAHSASAGTAEEDDTARLTDEARKTATSLLQQIGGELKKEYEISGPLRSVIVCKYTAPEFSDAEISTASA